MTTKEFAKACNVEKRTLFYYDEIGLLKPIKVHDNGYREYSSMQFSKMETIKLLQSSGMSLAEIKAVLTNEEDGRNIEIITECEKRVADQIKRLSDGRNYLLHRMMLRESYLQHRGEDVFIEHMEERIFSTITPEYRPHMTISYRHTGYYLGVAEDPISLRPQYLFKYALTDEADTRSPEGDYICSFYESAKGVYIPPFVENFLTRIKSLNYEYEGLVFVEDLPAWMLDRTDFLVLRFSVKLKSC